MGMFNFSHVYFTLRNAAIIEARLRTCPPGVWTTIDTSAMTLYGSMRTDLPVLTAVFFFSPLSDPLFIAPHILPGAFRLSSRQTLQRL